MTIASHIAILRALIKQYSDDSSYEDEFLYRLLNNANAAWLKKKLENNEKISDWNWLTYCIELEAGLSHDCDCIPVGCKVLKSVYKIPKPLMAKNRLMIKVTTLDGRDIPYTTPEAVKASKYDEVRRKQLAFSIVNGKIVIWNGNPELLVPRAIMVKTLSVDPSEWATVNACDPITGNATDADCFNIYTSEYPMDEDYGSLAYDTVIKQLGFSIQIPENRTNNANPDI